LVVCFYSRRSYHHDCRGHKFARRWTARIDRAAEFNEHLRGARALANAGHPARPLLDYHPQLHLSFYLSKPNAASRQRSVEKTHFCCETR
jgi:hypothetical protein